MKCGSTQPVCTLLETNYDHLSNIWRTPTKLSDIDCWNLWVSQTNFTWNKIFLILLICYKCAFYSYWILLHVSFVYNKKQHVRCKFRYGLKTCKYSKGTSTSAFMGIILWYFAKKYFFRAPPHDCFITDDFLTNDQCHGNSFNEVLLIHQSLLWNINALVRFLIK